MKWPFVWRKKYENLLDENARNKAIAAAKYVVNVQPKIVIENLEANVGEGLCIIGDDLLIKDTMLSVTDCEAALSILGGKGILIQECTFRNVNTKDIPEGT